MTDAEGKLNSQPICDEQESVASTSADSYQAVHSLLLCPAQWSALLDSSPISLVRQGSLHSLSPSLGESELANERDTCSNTPVTEEERSACMNEDVQCSDEDESGEQAQPQQQAKQKEEKEEMETEQKEQDEREIDQFIGRTMTEVDIIEEVGLPPLSEETSSSSKDSSGTCVQDHTGGKDSTPHTPLSESRLPLSYLSTNLTHSRNISETPSLPSYINSSTSSAYHSRNSSMTSQLTSEYLDSDSQFTDIDSCIVLQTGSCSRAMGRKFSDSRPVSLQDSRYKFPEHVTCDESSVAHRQCYSVCDLRPGQIKMPEHLQVTGPVTFDDTLKHSRETDEQECDPGPVESFEEKHQAAVMKSSEWIKREMSRARHSIIHYKVSSKCKHVVHFNVKAGDLIIWEFATKKKDIGLGLSFEPTQVATVESPEPSDEDEPVKKSMDLILPVLRVNSHTRPVIGSHTATQDGIYEIMFDNSYSRFFAKELFYRISTQPSVPNENYRNQ